MERAKIVFIFALLFCFLLTGGGKETAEDRKESDSGTAFGVSGSEPVSDTEMADAKDMVLKCVRDFNEKPSASDQAEETEDIADTKMNVQIGNASFTAALEDNAATHELVEMMKQGAVSIEMSDYSGFEKVGPLGRSLTTDNHQTTTSAGDIVLYRGDQIVMFYGSNSWSYTRIGKIDDLSGWEEALGNGSITAVFTIAE